MINLFNLYFFLDYFIRIQCRSGMCRTPMEVTASQLIASDIFPVPVVKTLLYPGAIVNVLVSNMTVPRWGEVLKVYNLTDAKEASPVPDLQRLEVCLINIHVLTYMHYAKADQPNIHLSYANRFIAQLYCTKMHPLFTLPVKLADRLIYKLSIW